MTKTIRFNLSGNRLFRGEEPQIIIEDTGSCLADYANEEEEIRDDIYHYEHPTTFRDIAVLLYMGCGHGVEWQLARELAKELDLDKKDVLIALEKIVREYAEMEDDEGIERYNKFAKYIKTHQGMPEEKEEDNG